MKPELVKTSKYLSLLLRHQPETIGLALDSEGWADIDELITKAAVHGRRLSRTLIEQVVAENDKQRFALSPDGTKIRANQGHSIRVDLKLQPQTPPEWLYHGTATRFLDSIRRTGLLPASRQHVHLSLDEATARKVGQRHGKPIVLPIAAGRMAGEGFVFYCSDNGVWLTDAVPPEYIEFPEV